MELWEKIVVHLKVEIFKVLTKIIIYVIMNLMKMEKCLRCIDNEVLYI